MPQNGADPVEYPYAFTAPSNTGIPSGYDLDNNGSVGGPNDAFGFGFFPGQYGMAVYPRYPIDEAAVRTFQTLLWADMPGAMLPDDPSTPEPADWYSEQELQQVRLSKQVALGRPGPGRREHGPLPAVAPHPAGLRRSGGPQRHPEPRRDPLLARLPREPGALVVIVDDQGRRGGLRPGSSFVIAGDLNSDPLDGDSLPGRRSRSSASRACSPSRCHERGRRRGRGAAGRCQPRPRHAGGAGHRGLLGLLARATFAPTTSCRATTCASSTPAVFWLPSSDPLSRLTTGSFPSDHRLVHVDVRVPGAAGPADREAATPRGDAAAPIDSVGVIPTEYPEVDHADTT